jgi:ribosomal protein S27E
VPGIYRPRHPERTVLYRVLFHNFDRFLTVYESRFEKEYGHFRPVVKEVVERYLDCGNPCSGFARIRCPDCHSEQLLTFSCKTRGFCPSCHAKRCEEWGQGLLSPEWAERILSWRHTGFNVHSRIRARTKTEAERIGKYMVRPVLALDRLSFLEREGRVGYRHGDDGAELERMDYLELIARVTSHIPDKGQVMVRYYGLYANAHRGKVRKAGRVPVALGMLEEELPRVPSKGWAEMIRKVYEVDPMICPRCGGRMRVVAFLTEYAVVDRIIRHLELTFVAEKPPPAYALEQVALMAAEESGEYE